MKIATITLTSQDNFRITEYSDVTQSEVKKISVFPTRTAANNYCTEEHILVVAPIFFLKFTPNMYKLHTETKSPNAKLLTLCSLHPLCKMASEHYKIDNGEITFILDEHGLRMELTSWISSMTGVMTTSRKIGELLEDALVKAIRKGTFKSMEDLGFELTVQ